MIIRTLLACLLLIIFPLISFAEQVVIGLNYPETGPYAVQGLAQKRAADMAVAEINGQGGILGKQIKLVAKDTKSNAKQSEQNVAQLIDQDGAQMVFGGSSSAVAIAGGKVAKQKDRIYFGTLTYSNATTGKDGHTHMFRECYNAWMGAKVLSKYLNDNFAGKKFFYITADYTWGWTTEESIRHFSNTLDDNAHKRAKTPFPGATKKDFKKALTLAKANKPDVLVLVLFGNDMAEALTLATKMGLKRKMAVVVPNITLGMAESAGPKVMEDVVGAVPWYWKVPEMTNSEAGKSFVANFAKQHNSYPSSSAASAYTILYQYKEAVEAVKSFETKAIINHLNGKSFTFLKDQQVWRAFDHQNVQTVFAVKGKPQEQVLQDPYKQDYFEIIASMPGEEAARSFDEWKASRSAAGLPETLE